MLLVVQRGHVPRTSGRTGAPGEQAFAIAAADAVVRRVRPLGVDVRVIDADPPSSAYRGDLFVALHYDSSTNPTVRGASVGYRSPEGQAFAHAWKRQYALEGWAGGFRADNYTDALAGYYGVRRALEQGNRYAFISEAGFHSNPADAAQLAGPEGHERVARAVAAAVAEIAGIPDPDQPQEDDDMQGPYLLAANGVGNFYVDGSGASPIYAQATIDELVAQKIPVWRLDANRDDALNIVRQRWAGTDEELVEVVRQLAP